MIDMSSLITAIKAIYAVDPAEKKSLESIHEENMRKQDAKKFEAEMKNSSSNEKTAETGSKKNERSKRQGLQL